MNSFRLINLSGNGEYAKYAPVMASGFALVRDSHISALCLDTALVCKAGSIAENIALCADGVNALSMLPVSGISMAKVKDAGEWRERNADERAATLEKLYAHIGEAAPAVMPEVKTRSRKTVSAPETRKASAATLEKLAAPVVPAIPSEKKPGRITRAASKPVAVPASVAVAAETPAIDFQAQINAIAASVAQLAQVVAAKL